MAFRIAARALLELGKELISSDEVAIYELIKNSVDARSPSIQLNFNIVLSRTKYVEARDRIGQRSAKEILYLLEMSVDPSAQPEQARGFLEKIDTMLKSGESLEDAIDEAYRAFNWIEIADQGHGMSLVELDRNFLTVGTRSRRAANTAGAQFLGDKGVGRLSAMRLGDRLEVTTTKEGEKHLNRLEIDWSAFSHDSDLAMADIPVAPRQGDLKSNRDFHGTTVRIADLTGDWTLSRVKDLIEGKIARMIDPFESGAANKLMVAGYNGKRVLVPSIPRPLLKGAHAVCKAQFRIENQQPVIEGEMSYDILGGQRKIYQRGVEVQSISQRVYPKVGKKGHAASEVAPIRAKALVDLGAFDVEIYWYNRRIVDAIEDLTENMQQTRDQIAQWSGGPMIYRKLYRILPYGDPNNDWLELDKNAFKASGFKLNRQQLIGRIRISATHVALSEQTNREGFVESDVYQALRSIVQWLMHIEFRNFINDVDELHKEAKIVELVAGVDLNTRSKQIDVSFSNVAAAAGSQADESIKRTKELIEELKGDCGKVLEAYKLQAEGAKTEREKFVHLAGIGLVTEFIFHELDRSLQHTIKTLSGYGSSPNKELLTLQEQLVTLQKRVSAFDELSGARRQTKKTFEVREAVEQVLQNHEAEFQRHGITARIVGKSTFPTRAVRGMFLQILENLITNSTYWLKGQTKIEDGFSPQIRVELDATAKTVRVFDNGVGIDPDRREIIFQPFITSKPAGQGRGLGLYIARELAKYHGWTLQAADKPGQFHQDRINEFVLELN